MAGIGRTPDAPRILVSAPAALGHWLLDMCGNGQPVESLPPKMPLGGRSVMPTAVAAGACVAHPDLGGAAALALSESRHCIDLDKEGKGRVRANDPVCRNGQAGEGL